jgi:DNA modification methylase
MKEAGRTPHPAILPASVARFCLLLSTEKNGLVYDPFAGSGTIPVEAMALGRRSLASERSREYLEGSLIRARLAGIEMASVA